MRLLVTGGSGFIGTNLVALAVSRGWDVQNIDIRPPREPLHAPYWREVDILDADSLRRTFSAFAPTHVAHLAARTDTDAGTFVHDYPANTRGTANVLDSCKATPSITRTLITSTQFVGRPGFTPDGDESYDPHTSYGWSKVITEQLTRYSGYTPWTIVRPTTIWGPYSLTHPYRMVGAMRRGLYVHPGRQPCLRSWGYVGNVVHQMMHVLTTSEAQVIGKVFYVGDPPIDLVDFVDAFSRRVTGHPVRVVPRTVVRNLARIGDVVSTLSKKPFLLQSERFHSMTEPYPVPLEPIHELVGKMPFGLQEGIESSLQWLESRRS